MKFKLFFLFSFLFFLQINAQLKQGVFYKIWYVNDGDTFMIRDENLVKYKIRLIGIDAPESVNWGLKKHVQLYGYEAKMYLRTFLYHKKVRLEFDVTKLDKYGRSLAYAFLEDSTFINKNLVENGYAKVYTFPPNVKYVEVFKKAEKLARKKKLGLWKEQ